MLCRAVLWFALCVTVLANTSERESRLVKLANGSVKGYKNPETGIYEFRSIPYATAPKGVHKFKAPLPPPVWLQPLEAVDRNIICPQAKFPQVELNKVEQEDCLIASVYVPDTKEEKLPVVVYVHGGAFQIGYGDWIVPTDLIKEHNIITVTFNYRLGVHGFLCLGTEDIPGNAGMKDQVALLKWVQRNIASFGGNPEDVTIAGYSAGSASVDLLMLSKAAKGLFHKVIPESGSSTAVFTVQPDPLANAKWYATSLNFTNVDDIYALEEFYKTTSFELLTSDPFDSRLDSTFAFSPCVEYSIASLARSINNDVFLDESPIQILRKGNFKILPVLLGFANMEGLLRVGFFETWKDQMNEKFSDFLPADLIFENDKEREEVANKIKEFYFGDKPVSSENVLSYVNYFSDVLFTYPSLREVKQAVESGHDQIYLYEYSFVDDNTPVVPHTDVKGANHCSQTIAVMSQLPVENPTQQTFTEEFKKMSSTMRQLWANFIKTGKPVPEGSSLPSWPPVSKGWAPHMSISNELVLKETLLEERTRFWEGIYSKYYRRPIPPPVPPMKHSEL